MAKQRFGDRLLGVVINDIPDEQYETAIEVLHPYLEKQGVPVLALMPENRTLKSVSIAEIIEQLGATVLCQPENVELDKIMVEELKIGAMDVNSAQSYFRKSYNKVVVTGSSRIDLQFAALETSTNCIILTGRPIVNEDVAHKAMELGVPILAVSKDTLSTVSIIEASLGQVRLHEGVKVTSICDMMAQYFNFNRLRVDFHAFSFSLYWVLFSRLRVELSRAKVQYVYVVAYCDNFNYGGIMGNIFWCFFWDGNLLFPFDGNLFWCRVE
jgi:BioD-like phosphotransacetylase family protein